MSEIMKPTIRQILGVHPFAIRPRVPPPMRVSAGFAGRLHWQLVDRFGIIEQEGEQHNLILDQGLDQVASTSILRYTGDSIAGINGTGLAQYVAVGTGSTAETTSDTVLDAEIARTGTSYQSFAYSRPSDGVIDLTKYFEFDYTQANGNLAEWGTSWGGGAGSNLFSRALFLDGGGAATTITKTSAYKLRMIYTLEVTVSPTTFTAGSFVITNVGTITGNYRLFNSRNASSADVNLISAFARGATATVGGAPSWPGSGSIEAYPADLSGATYTSGAESSYVSGSVARSVDTAWSAYTPGSYARSGAVMKWDTAYANITIYGFRIWGVHLYDSASFASDQRVGYLFDFDAGLEFAKDNTHTLTVGLPDVSWGRT